MKQSYPTGMVAEDMRLPLTFENYQGRLLVSEMAHVVMPNEKVLCGVCRKEIFITYDHQRLEECCGITYTRRIHSYMIEATAKE